MSVGSTGGGSSGAPASSVSVTNFPATQPVSGAAGAALALDGTDISAPTAMPAGGVGIRGWLSAIWTKLNGSLAVTGTFWQATQPVSGTVSLGAGAAAVGSVSVSNFPATQNTDVTDRAARLLGVVASIAGALPTGANTIGAVTNANLDVALSTRLKPADTLAGVTTVAAVTAITNALPAGTNKLGTVDIATAPAVAKGTQGANGVPTQDLKDSGRSARTITLDSFAVAATAETLMTMSYSTDNGALSTGTSYAVTAGKRLRITAIMASLHTIAGNTTAVGVIVRLRANNGGAAVLASPVQAVLPVQGVAAANQGGFPTFMDVPDGWEFVAGAGIGVTVACPGFVATTAAPKVDITIIGYEY